ncbi:MAG: hypothetical protein SNJ78_07900 [Spirochaetales bacterium]
MNKAHSSFLNILGFGIVLYSLIFFGCASAPKSKSPEPAKSSPTAATPPSAQTQPDVYLGKGESDSLLRAMNAAKMDAVRKAVIDMIGSAQEQANAKKLEEVLYSTSNPNAYVRNEAMETLRRDSIGGRFIYEIRIPVNRAAIESTLRAHGILKDPTTQDTSRAAAQDLVRKEAVATPAREPAREVEEPPKYAEPTPEEKAFLRRYLDSLTYMVYFNEESKEDPFLMKTAVGMANSVLLSNRINAVDFAEVEKLKKDQQILYEEETGKEMSMIQWIAQKLNADVYIEIDAVTEGETQGSNHYGSAKINLKIFESSTGSLLGSVPFSSPRTFSRVSQFDAKANALQSTLFRAMPIAVEQAKNQLAKVFERGIRYELVLQKTSDSRLMTRFRSRLRDRVADLQVINQSAESTKFAVFFFGRIDQLEELIYSVADAVPGLEGMEQVVIRGKTLVFNTGLK